MIVHSSSLQCFWLLHSPQPLTTTTTTTDQAGGLAKVPRRLHHCHLGHQGTLHRHRPEATRRQNRAVDLLGRATAPGQLLAAATARTMAHRAGPPAAPPSSARTPAATTRILTASSRTTTTASVTTAVPNLSSTTATTAPIATTVAHATCSRQSHRPYHPYRPYFRCYHQARRL